jgi:hypothetical protein
MRRKALLGMIQLTHDFNLFEDSNQQRIFILLTKMKRTKLRAMDGARVEKVANVRRDSGVRRTYA